MALNYGAIAEAMRTQESWLFGGGSEEAQEAVGREAPRPALAEASPELNNVERTGHIKGSGYEPRLEHPLPGSALEARRT